MSVELRKKSSSFTQSTNPLKTIPKHQTRQTQLSTCRSVSVFADNTKNQPTNKNKEIEKFSIENGRQYSAKKYCDETRPQNKSNSFVGYKEAIQKRKKKGVQGKKNFTEELFITIDTFQETLLSLPLEKLILSQNPFHWVEVQVKTLQKLQQKFMRITNTLKAETKHYYQTKLQSVAIVIKNMNENLNSLNGINMLKNYGSGGTSIQSRNSQSTSSLGHTSNFPYGFKEKQTHNKSRYQTQTEDKINQGPNYATDFSSSEGLSSRNEQNKQNVIRYSNQMTRNSKFRNQLNVDKKAFQKVEIIEKDQFFLKEYKSSNSENQHIMDQIKTLRSQKYLLEDEEKYSKLNQKSKLNQFLSRDIENQNNLSYEQNASFFKKKNMNQTVSKYQQKYDPEQIQTMQNLGRFASNESKETFNTIENQNHMESIDCGEQTKRRNVLGTNSSGFQHNEQLNVLKKQIQTKNQIIVHLETKHEKIINVLKEEFAKKEKHYLQTIYELREENIKKQESIKQLLLERQGENDQLDLTKRELSQKIQISKKMVQKLSLLQQSAETLTNELRKYKIREDELRETVQLERQRTKKLQKEIQEIETQMDEMKMKSKEISDKNTEMVMQNEKLSKQIMMVTEGKEKMKEKEEIYKLKYFKLYAEFDRFKQKVNEDSEYWKKICLSCKKQYINPQNTDPQKQTELRELINFHKKRLLCE